MGHFALVLSVIAAGAACAAIIALGRKTNVDILERIGVWGLGALVIATWGFLIWAGIPHT